MTGLVILAPLFLFLSKNPFVQEWAAHYKSQARNGLIWFCGIALLGTLAIELAVAQHDLIFHDEATVLCIAAAFHHGQQIYPLTGAPVEYALLYGPMTYLVYLPPMILRSDHLGVFLIWVAFAFGASLFILALVLKRQFTIPIALCSTVLLAVYAAPCLHYEWAVRGDVWILLSTALGLWAARIRSAWVSAIVISILGAILTDLKLPLFAVGLLPSIALWERSEAARRPAIVSVVCMPLFALVPFLNRNISLQGYLLQLSDASHHGLALHNFARNSPFLLYLLLPTLGLLWLGQQVDPFATRAFLKSRAVYLSMLGCALVLAIITSAKYGAGPWHLMSVAIPLIAIDATLFEISWSPTSKVGGSYLRTLALPSAIAVVMLSIFVLELRRGVADRLEGPEGFSVVSMPAVERDLEAIIRDHPNADLAMGYTDLEHYSITSARPLLQLRGKRLFIDAVARNEADLSNKPLPANVLRALQTCQTKLWVLPAEGVPFSMESLYYLGGSVKQKSLYPQSVSDAFITHYRRIAASRYFAVWQCNPMQSGL